MPKSKSYNASGPQPVPAGGTGRQMARGIAGGIIVVILVGVVAFLWNSYSTGGLVRALGGITSQELAKEIAQHPGPQGPSGPAGPRGNSGPPGTAPVITVIAQMDADYAKSGPIPSSEAYPLCTLSKIILRQNVKNPDRSCQLKRAAQPGGKWEVLVNEAICGVTCFTIGGDK